METKDTTLLAQEQVNNPVHERLISAEEEGLLYYQIDLYYNDKLESDTELIQRLLDKYLIDMTGVLLSYDEEIRFIFLKNHFFSLSGVEKREYYQLRDKKFSDCDKRPNNEDFIQVHLAILEGAVHGIPGKYDFNTWKENIEVDIDNSVRDSKQKVFRYQTILRQVEDAYGRKSMIWSTSQTDNFSRDEFFQKQIEYLKDRISLNSQEYPLKAKLKDLGDTEFKNFDEQSKGKGGEFKYFKDLFITPEHWIAAIEPLVEGGIISKEPYKWLGILASGLDKELSSLVKYWQENNFVNTNPTSYDFKKLFEEAFKVKPVDPKCYRYTTKDKSGKKEAIMRKIGTVYNNGEKK